MERRLRTNLLLLGAVAILAMFVWLAPPPGEDKPAYFLFDPATEISHIAVLHDGDVQFELRKHDGWQLLQPYALPADDFQVNALLETLRQPAFARYSSSQADLAELGLAHPAWRIQLDSSEIAFGGRAAVGNRHYALKGDEVFLVDDVLSYRVQRPPLDYASRRLLGSGKDLESLSLPNGATVQRQDSGWSLRPEQVGASADMLQGLIDAWQQANATRLVPAASVPRQGVATIRLTDGDILQFGIEQTADELRLTRDDPAVTYILPVRAAGELLQLQPDSE